METKVAFIKQSEPCPNSSIPTKTSVSDKKSLQNYCVIQCWTLGVSPNLDFKYAGFERFKHSMLAAQGLQDCPQGGQMVLTGISDVFNSDYNPVIPYIYSCLHNGFNDGYLQCPNMQIHCLLVEAIFLTVSALL